MPTKQPDEPNDLDAAITAAFADLDNYHAEDKEYAAAVDQITKLYAIKQNHKPDRLSKDTLAVVAANILGIIVIVGYEQKNVLTSKAAGFVQKLR